MQLLGEIISCHEDTYQGRRGTVRQRVLTLLDRGPHPRMKNTMDFMLTVEQAEGFPVHSDGLAGKSIEVAVTEIGDSFGGRMRIKGQIVKFEP